VPVTPKGLSFVAFSYSHLGRRPQAVDLLHEVVVEALGGGNISCRDLVCAFGVAAVEHATTTSGKKSKTHTQSKSNQAVWVFGRMRETDESRRAFKSISVNHHHHHQNTPLGRLKIFAASKNQIFFTFGCCDLNVQQKSKRIIVCFQHRRPSHINFCMSAGAV
jgi:hypothetical protein